MKRAVGIGLASVALTAMVTIVAAWSRSPEPVADAQSGDIVPVAPVRPANEAYGPPRLSAAPRIIHVPQPAAPDDDDEEQAAPPRPRVRQVMPRPQRQSETPPDARRRPFATTTPPLHDGPSPVRPTPRFSAKAERGEKFPPPPPPGYTPPANLPPSAAPQADAARGD